MRRKLFGTDGIRAPFGEPPLDERTVSLLGYHLAGLLRRRSQEPVVVLGGDTRESTPILCRWLAAGLQAGGASWRFAGVVPTPAVAFLARDLEADGGVAVSASHNLPPDNGIKLFNRGGFKWASESEAALERQLDRSAPIPALGTDLEPEEELARRYREHLTGLPPGEAPLKGLRLAVDAANGAASAHAGPVLEALGAEVTVFNAEPDGTNINRECGSTHPQALAREVARGSYDLGVAFDGDADRAILVDEAGGVQDGDVILYLWARDLVGRGELHPPSIVATSMSNLGLERALEPEGVEVVRCDVGDRVVVETLRLLELKLGGEQSGHIVHLDHDTTGDGLQTAVCVASILRRSGEAFSQLVSGFRRYPQVLRNVRVREKRDFAQLPAVLQAAWAVEEQLGDRGRLVLRYSGTEPLARVMIEGEDEGEIQELAGHLLDAIREAVGESE